MKWSNLVTSKEKEIVAETSDNNYLVNYSAVRPKTIVIELYFTLDLQNDRRP